MLEILTPPPNSHAGQWAESFFHFSPGDPEQGRYRQHRVPWWAPVFESARHPDVRQVTIVTGSQMSKTTTLMLIIMHRLHHGPRVPCMFVAPSKDLAKSIAERMSQAIQDCPPLYAMMEKGRRARVLERWFAGVRLGWAWAGSKIQMRSHPVGLAVADEADAFPSDVEGEGHPLVLLAARTKNYVRSLTLVTGTPTVEGVSAIEREWLEGSREILQWQCPHCEHWHQPLPAHMRWPEGADPTTAELQGGMHCPACDERITDDHVSAMRQNARWWPYDVQDDGTLHPAPALRPYGAHRSYWATGPFSPWQTLAHLRHRLCAAYRSRDANHIKAELNTFWGVWWQESGERPRWEAVRDHAATYKRGQLPDHTRGLILAVDVQQDRLEWALVAFGANFRKMVVDWGTLWGDPQYDDIWLALGSFQHRKYGSLSITRCIVDSGYSPGYDFFQRPQHRVYEFCRRHYGWAYSYKGYAEQRETVRLSKSQRDGILYLVNASYFKRMIYAEINSTESSLSVPADVTEDYCRQLVSEELIVLPSGRLKWRTRRSEPNHQLDCLVMACACAYTLNWQQIDVVPETGPAQRPSAHIRMPNLRRR